MYLVEVASLEDLTALESSKDLWNSGKVLKKHPLRGWKTSVWSSCLTAGVIPLCTNALVECVGKGRGMGEEGRWGERGEMEMAEERARSWAQIRRREETWELFLFAVPHWLKKVHSPAWGGLLTVTGSTYQRLSPGMKGTPVSPDALEHLQTHTVPAPHWAL